MSYTLALSGVGPVSSTAAMLANKLIMFASPLPPQQTWDLATTANELGAAQADVTSATLELARFYLSGSDGTTVAIFAVAGGVQQRRVTDAAAAAFQSDGKLTQALAGVIAKLTV